MKPVKSELCNDAEDRGHIVSGDAAVGVGIGVFLSCFGDRYRGVLCAEACKHDSIHNINRAVEADIAGFVGLRGAVKEHREIRFKDLCILVCVRKAGFGINQTQIMHKIQREHIGHRRIIILIFGHGVKEVRVFDRIDRQIPAIGRCAALMIRIPQRNVFELREILRSERTVAGKAELECQLGIRAAVCPVAELRVNALDLRECLQAVG